MDASSNPRKADDDHAWRKYLCLGNTGNRWRTSVCLFWHEWKLNVGGGRSVASPTADRDHLYFGTERRSDGGGFLFAVGVDATMALI